MFWLCSLCVPPFGAAVEGEDSATGHRGQVTIVVLPDGIVPGDLTGLEHAAIGLLNPGLGEVPAQQTWLDVSQGSRAFDTSYDTPEPRPRRSSGPADLA